MAARSRRSVGRGLDPAANPTVPPVTGPDLRSPLPCRAGDFARRTLFCYKKFVLKNHRFGGAKAPPYNAKQTTADPVTALSRDVLRAPPRLSQFKKQQGRPAFAGRPCRAYKVVILGGVKPCYRSLRRLRSTSRAARPPAATRARPASRPTGISSPVCGMTAAAGAAGRDFRWRRSDG